MNYGIDTEKVLEVVLAFRNDMKHEKLLDILLTKMMELTFSDAGTLYILEDDKLHFRILRNNTLGVFQSAEEAVDLPSITLDRDNIENAGAYAAIHNEIVIIDDVYRDDRFNFSGPKKYDSITGYRTRSMLVLPLSVLRNEKTEIIGVIQLLNPTDPTTGEPSPYGNIFNPPFIVSLANLSANMLANMLHVSEIRNLFHSFVEVMTTAIDERSSFSSNHTRNVTRLCMAFARHLNTVFPHGHEFYFNDRRLDELCMAAQLHDIGKIITPLEVMDKSSRLGRGMLHLQYRFEIKKHQLEISMLKGEITREEHERLLAEIKNAMKFIESIQTAYTLSDEQINRVNDLSRLYYRDSRGEAVPLLNPWDIEALSVRNGNLTNVERAVMQQHVAFTGKLLDGIAFTKYYKNVPIWARSHHEFLDGTGYFGNFAAGTLPIEVCVITIADIFDALTASDRPYKKAVSVEKALEILKEMANEGKLHGVLLELFTESRVWL